MDERRDAPPKAAVDLEYAFCDDWLIFARGSDGSWWYTITETWPEWADVAEREGVEPGEAGAGDDDVERHMVPLVTGWNSAEPPTRSTVVGRAGWGTTSVGPPEWRPLSPGAGGEPSVTADELADLERRYRQRREGATCPKEG